MIKKNALLLELFFVLLISISKSSFSMHTPSASDSFETAELLTLLKDFNSQAKKKIVNKEAFVENAHDQEVAGHKNSKSKKAKRAELLRWYFEGHEEDQKKIQAEQNKKLDQEPDLLTF